MSLNSTLAKAAFSSVVALNTKIVGSVTGALALPVNGSLGIEWDSLVANVSAGITTNTITVQTRWEVSQDGVTFIPLFGMNGAANVGIAPAGTGGLITTAYAQAASGINPSHQFVRLACVVGVVTGGAGDNITISYNYRRRNLVA